MAWITRVRSIIIKRGAYYFTIKLLLSMFVLVYAASITATTTVYRAETGGALKVTNNLTATDKGFTKAGSTLTAAGNCPAANVTFSSSAQTANNAITSGDLIFDVQVNTTASTPLVSCFTVSLTLTPNGGSQTTYTAKIASGASVSAGWTIDCKFDIGTSLPASPYSFRVTVQ